MVDRLWNATEAFWGSLTDIHWLPLLLAIGVHVLRLACTSRAWRNVLAAAYPDERVLWRRIFAAYTAGVGVNAILPARSGDVLRVVLAHRAIPG
ncbi:MAG: lysylphosphatidylglycerol synthase domain-containing protein, partial [Gaiella sp.]